MSKKLPPHERPAPEAIQNAVNEQIFEQARAYAEMPPAERNAAVARIREVRARSVEREEQSNREWAEEIMAIGERATGLTRDQIMAKAAEYQSGHQPIKRAPTPRERAAARGVPERHMEGIADRDPIKCDALDAVRQFVESDQQTMLVLGGAVGLRKSGSACWALTQTEGRYVLAANLSKIAASKDEWRDEWVRIRKAPLLVVDELSTEYTDDKGFFYVTVNALVQERYTACVKTIFTYNKGAAAFRKAYGERIASRVNECGRFVELGGVDVRGHVEHWSERGER